MGLLQTLKDEWPTVVKAPWLLMSVASAAFLAGGAVSAWWWSGQVAVMRERLGYYEDRLKNAPPKPIEPQIEALKLQSFRVVPAEKRERLVSDLRAHAGRVHIISDDSVPDAEFVTKDLRNLFSQAGWTVHLSIFFDSREQGRKGIAVFAKPDQPSAAKLRESVFQGLRTAGLNAEVDAAVPKVMLSQPDDYEIGIRVFDR